MVSRVKRCRANGRSGFIVRLGRNEDGTTAVEFGFVALPFFFLLFGIISIGFYYFTLFTLENAIEEAARLARTGQAQTGTFTGGTAGTPMTAAQFKTEVCSRLPAYMNCTTTGKIRVQMQNFTDFASVAIPSCLDGGGNLIDDASAVFAPGSASTVTLATICYEWELPKLMPTGFWLRPNSANSSTMSNGSSLMQAATTFVTEPFS